MVRHDGAVGDLVAVEDRVSALEGDLSIAREGPETVIGGRLPRTDSVMESA